MREMQIKITMGDHFTPIRTATIPKTSVGENMEKLEALYTVGAKIKW